MFFGQLSAQAWLNTYKENSKYLHMIGYNISSQDYSLKCWLIQIIFVFKHSPWHGCPSMGSYITHVVLKILSNEYFFSFSCLLKTSVLQLPNLIEKDRGLWSNIFWQILKIDWKSIGNLTKSWKPLFTGQQPLNQILAFWPIFLGTSQHDFIKFEP